jgi:hypothetical protein
MIQGLGGNYIITGFGLTLLFTFCRLSAAPSSCLKSFKTILPGRRPNLSYIMPSGKTDIKPRSWRVLALRWVDRVHIPFSPRRAHNSHLGTIYDLLQELRVDTTKSSTRPPFRSVCAADSTLPFLLPLRTSASPDPLPSRHPRRRPLQPTHRGSRRAHKLTNAEIKELQRGPAHEVCKSHPISLPLSIALTAVN